MRRPTVRRQQPGIALFPFLAVLICTMGSLIVLLVMVVQQARASAAQVLTSDDQSSSPSDEQLRQLKEQEEDLQWRADMLQQQRDAYAKTLSDKRLELAHLEDHIRRLEDDAKKLIAQVEALRSKDKNDLADQKRALQQVAELEQEIAEKQRELNEARKQVLRRRPAYAILPYDGPNGTSRRPMYVECTEEGIVLQPEGVVLNADDFQGPLGPGNPLDAALRATREHLKRSGLQSEPYPLIIVRPNGALAFGACRTAMKHWESEFGYELVDQDAELKYPPADAQLAATLERAVKDARQRQSMLAAAMPNRFGAEGRQASFRAADNPDPTLDDGGGASGRGATGGATANRGVPSFASGGSGMGTGPRGATGIGGSGTSGQGGPGDRATAAAGYTQTGAYGQRTTAGQPVGGGNSSQPGARTAASGPSGQGNSSGSQSYAGGATGGNAPSGSTTPQGPGATSMMSSGARSGSPGAAATSQGGNSAGTSGSNSSAQLNSSGTPSPSMMLSPQMAKARKQIKSRGENWGLPNSSPKATAITRPIWVECHADRLLILPEKGELRTPLVVPIEDDVAQNLDAFVDAVWRHMDRWGLAVLGGYWKPILTVDVKPGGEQRFAELQLLMQGSGIEVERK